MRNSGGYYEVGYEDQNCHEVLDGLGAFDDEYDAYCAAVDAAESDLDGILEDYPDAVISNFKADHSCLTVSFDVDDGVFRTITHKVTKFELHHHSEVVRETQKRVHESTKSMFAQKKAELGL